MATWRSTPNSTDSSGTMITPPPMPTNAPNIPVATDAAKASRSKMSTGPDYQG